MMNSILVTGTAGFIGYHVAKHVLQAGHRVMGYDNVCPYYPVSVKNGRLESLRTHEESFLQCDDDLCDIEALRRCFATCKPDVVCHLAAQAGVRYSIENPLAFQRSNLEGFMNVIECCREFRTPRLVYASSSSVYGGNTKLPFAVSDNVDKPISLYAATKRANELIAHCYSHLFGIQTVGLRFFTVYGPWGRPDMGMWIFTEKILNGEPIEVFNHGDMKRDFTFIADIVAGVTSALFSPHLEPTEIFNLGNHRCESLMDMIGIIEACLERKANIRYLPMQPGDVPATYADIEHSQRQLGYVPATTIADGVPRFCDWYLQHPDLASDVRAWRQAAALKKGV